MNFPFFLTFFPRISKIYLLILIVLIIQSRNQQVVSPLPLFFLPLICLIIICMYITFFFFRLSGGYFFSDWRSRHKTKILLIYLNGILFIKVALYINFFIYYINYGNSIFSAYFQWNLGCFCEQSSPLNYPCKFHIKEISKKIHLLYILFSKNKKKFLTVISYYKFIQNIFLFISI